MLRKTQESEDTLYEAGTDDTEETDAETETEVEAEVDDEADDENTTLVLNEQDSSTAKSINTIETKDHIDKMQVSSASADDVYETKECKKEDRARAASAAAAAVERESKAKAALARAVDILISTKKKVKFTQIHGSSFSIGSRADGELTIKGQKVVSDAKRTDILDKGSFLQLMLYGFSYQRDFAMVAHTSRKKICLSVLNMSDHRSYLHSHIIKNMEKLSYGLFVNPSRFVRSFFSLECIAERCQVFTQHIERCPMPDLQALQMPSLVQLQKQTQKAAAGKRKGKRMKEIVRVHEVEAPRTKSQKYERWSKFLCMEVDK